MQEKKSRLGRGLTLRGNNRAKCSGIVIGRSKVCQATGCWLWTGTMSGRYGVVKLGGLVKGNARAHRVAYAAFNGPIPAKLLVRHTCDTPNCVNPEHLLLGTEADNMVDKMDRGRWSGGRKPKELNFRVLRMLVDLGYSQERVASMLGVSRMVIRNRLRGVGLWP